LGSHANHNWYKAAETNAGHSVKLNPKKTISTEAFFKNITKCVLWADVHNM
jgi:hypothetical protein